MVIVLWLGILLFIVAPVVITLWVLSCVYLEHRRDRVPIMLYHRLIVKKDRVRACAVTDDEMIWVCYDDRFAEQMNYLRRNGYTTLDFYDYVDIRSGRIDRPKKPVVLTFDDGYESTYKLAFPVLLRHGLKATVFVAPEPDAHTRELVQNIDDFLTEDQMREMTVNGISIQSHTLTHAILTELDADQVMHELVESRRQITAITGAPVDHLAIPRAGYDRRVRRLAHRAGYRTVCCNNKGTANGLSARMALPRIVVERDMSLADFSNCLKPPTGTAIRIVGNIKRIPEWVGGARFSYRVRRWLYSRSTRQLFKLSTLKWVVAIGGLIYLAAAVAFWIRLTID